MAKFEVVIGSVPKKFYHLESLRFYYMTKFKTVVESDHPFLVKGCNMHLEGLETLMCKAVEKLRSQGVKELDDSHQLYLISWND